MRNDKCIECARQQHRHKMNECSSLMFHMKIMLSLLAIATLASSQLGVTAVCYFATEMQGKFSFLIFNVQQLDLAFFRNKMVKCMNKCFISIFRRIYHSNNSYTYESSIVHSCEYNGRFNTNLGFLP